MRKFYFVIFMCGGRVSRVPGMGSVACGLRAVVAISVRTRGWFCGICGRSCALGELLDFERCEPMVGLIDFVLGEWLL